MKHDDYPALFLDADNASNMYQRTFLRLIRGEYVALFFAAIFSMSFMNDIIYYVLYAGVFVVGLVILIARAQSKPEQWWYRTTIMDIAVLSSRVLATASIEDTGFRPQPSLPA